MTFPRVRLFVSAALFLGWLAFLLYLVIDSRKIVLSQPQFLSAQLYVVVEVEDVGGTASPDVLVDQVLWTSDPSEKQLRKLHLPDLAACGKSQGYRGAGKYVLPLIKSHLTPFRVAPIPRLEEIRIYSWTPDVRVQVERLIVSRS